VDPCLLNILSFRTNIVKSRQMPGDGQKGLRAIVCHGRTLCWENFFFLCMSSRCVDCNSEGINSATCIGLNVPS
jgi:hypothetical protein